METLLNDTNTDSRIFIYKNWLDQDLANSMMSEIANYSWEQRQVMIYGKMMNQARDVLLVGDSSITDGYSYSGQRLPLHDWYTDEYYWPLSICESLNEAWDSDFNSCLMNRYMSGDNHISYHSDDEKQLGLQGQVATVSLGASRTFRIRKRGQTTGYLLSVELQHGDLLLMEGNTQKYYTHAIIKEARVKSPRYSLTYRRFTE